MNFGTLDTRICFSPQDLTIIPPRIHSFFGTMDQTRLAKVLGSLTLEDGKPDVFARRKEYVP